MMGWTGLLDKLPDRVTDSPRSRNRSAGKSPGALARRLFWKDHTDRLTG